MTQSRLLWTFSHGHRRGYDDPGGDYLEAAEWGYRFLIDRLLDRRHGGYAWKADGAGRVVDLRKILYGQAFALFALVEYHRATGLTEPLMHARSLFSLVQDRMHDIQHSGWIEHCDALFEPLDVGVPVEGTSGAGLKSANAHLHWMEALSEYADVTEDASARSALDEVLRLNTTFFFPANPTAGHAYWSRDWRPIRSADSEIFSYGHGVEFAWLMLRAQAVLERQPDRERFDLLVRHALRFGFDNVRGGFYEGGPRVGPASHRDRIWWAQAEGMNALTEAARWGPDPEYDRALDLLLDWVLRHQRLRSGRWAPRVEPSGKRGSIVAPGAWKGGYHEVRAMVKFVDAFSTPPGHPDVRTDSTR